MSEKGWRRWFPDHRIPKAIEDIVRAGILKDTTWRESPMPHFETNFPDGSVVVLWVEHPRRESRFLDQSKRYEIRLSEKEELMDTVLETDDSDEVLAALRTLFQDKGGPQPTA